MSVAKMIELSGRSNQSFEQAIKETVAKANETVRNVREAWVKEQKVKIADDGSIAEYQVDVLITFILE